MSTGNTDIACVILAAGSGQRFGSDKMRFQIAGRQTLIELTADLYLSVFDQVTVVTSPWQMPEHPLQGWANIQLVPANRAQYGMSQSLIAGVKAHLDADAVMIALGDMPYVETATLQELCSAADPTRIVVPVTHGYQGNPVIFGRNYYKEIQEVSGDQGAKSLIAKYPQQVAFIELNDPGIFRDIDRIEDIA